MGIRARSKAAKLFYADAERGEGVMLQREAHNPYDKNAVMVLGPYEEHLGYIAREKAAVLAHFMDAGVIYLAKVSSPAERVLWKGDYKAVPNTLRVKCTPLEPPKAKAKKKVAAPIRRERAMVDDMNDDGYYKDSSYEGMRDV